MRWWGQKWNDRSKCQSKNDICKNVRALLQIDDVLINQAIYEVYASTSLPENNVRVYFVPQKWWYLKLYVHFWQLSSAIADYKFWTNRILGCLVSPSPHKWPGCSVRAVMLALLTQVFNHLLYICASLSSCAGIPLKWWEKPAWSYTAGSLTQLQWSQRKVPSYRKVITSWRPAKIVSHDTWYDVKIAARHQRCVDYNSCNTYLLYAASIWQQSSL